jgi:hypothetical protein
MMEYITQHKLISLLVLVLLIGAAWWGFTNVSGPAPVITTTDVGNATDTQDAQIVSTLLQLQAVTLSGAIFTDPGFLSLQDFTTQVVSEPVGRPNPFAPVSPDVPIATSTGTLNPDLFAPAKN